MESCRIGPNGYILTVRLENGYLLSHVNIVRISYPITFTSISPPTTGHLGVGNTFAH